MSVARTLAKNTLWGVLDLVVDLILPPVTSILVARAIGPVRLGQFTYVLWITTFAGALTSLGVHTGLRKFMADYAGQRRPDVVMAILRTGLLAEVVLGLVVVAAGLLWVDVYFAPQDRAFAVPAVVAVFPLSVMGAASAMNATMEDFRPNVIPSVVGGLMNALGIVITLVMDWGLVGLTASLLAGRIGDAALRWLLTVRRLPRYMADLQPAGGAPSRAPALPAGLGRQIIGFCAQATFLTLLTLVVWNRSELFFLHRFCDPRQVAFYSVAFSFAVLPASLVSPFSVAAEASLFVERGRSTEGGRAFTELYWRYLSLAVLPVCFGMAVLSGPLVRVLYGSAYDAAAPVLGLAAALALFAPLGSPMTALATAGGAQAQLVRWGLLAALITLVLDFVLARSFCAIGGALANGVGQAVSTATTWMIAYKHFGCSVSFHFLLRVAIAAIGMAVTVGFVGRVLSDLAMLFVGPPVGVVSYLVLLRLGHAVPQEDIERLVSLQSMLPARFRGAYTWLVYSLLPR